MISATRSVWEAQGATTRGIIMIVVSTFAFAIMHTAIRWLSDELHPFQIAFFRNLFGLLFLMPLIAQGGFAQMKTSRFGLHSLRGIVNIGAMLLFFYA